MSHFNPSSLEKRTSGLASAVIRIVFNKSNRNPELALEEAVGLAKAIDLNVLLSQTIILSNISPATLLSFGHVENLKTVFWDLHIKLVVIDATLSPVQQRNLEKIWNLKVIDRTMLILEIFGERAKTSEGALQVELASLEHQRSRLVRSWTHLERQRGGFGFIGGPGESQLELDKRLIQQRISKIKESLAKVKKTRALHRYRRKRSQKRVVSLVGYTNAGKSTLFNALTGSNTFQSDMLFATLDPTLRPLKGVNNILISDTVGFIAHLPTTLTAAFHATLEEVMYADLVLHVRDIAHVESDLQRISVLSVLKELGINSSDTESIHQPPIIEVCNKIDLLSDEDKQILQNRINRESNVIGVSALFSVDELNDRIQKEASIPPNE